MLGVVVMVPACAPRVWLILKEALQFNYNTQSDICMTFYILIEIFLKNIDDLFSIIFIAKAEKSRIRKSEPQWPVVSVPVSE